MLLEELLIKIGVDGSNVSKINHYIKSLNDGAQKIGDFANKIASDVKKSINNVGKGTEQTNESASKTGKSISKLKIGVAALVAVSALFAKRIVGAFDEALNKAKELYNRKDALFKISKKELDQATQYKRSMERVGLAMDSIKTKIALNLAPAITGLVDGFNKWLIANKELITNGITKVINVLGKAVQVIVNFVRFLDKIISKTIGWEKALIALGVAWSILNRKFLMSPIGKVMVLLTGLMLLIDDLMVYMDGGKSLFGKYWQPLIDGTKSVIEWFNSLSGTVQWLVSVFGGLFVVSLSGGKTLFSLRFLVGKVVKPFVTLGKSVFAFGGSVLKAFKMIGVAIRVVTMAVMANPIIATIIGIATLAYLVYKNWDWLKEQFSKILTSISSAFQNVWGNIVKWLSNAVKDILMYFGLTEDEADSVVSAIGDAFNLVTDLITAPFKAAWKFVTDLFGVWTDDSTSFTEKLGKTFEAIKDLLIAPFKSAMDWIKDVFETYIGGIKSKVNSLLSLVGMGWDEDISDEDKAQFTKAFEVAANYSTVTPSPLDSSKTINNGDINMQVTVNTSDTKIAAEQVGETFAKTLVDTANNNRSALGVY